MDIIRISWIYAHFVSISTFRGYSLHFVDIIRIGQITIYLACNVCHVLRSFVLVMDNIFGRITGYLACNCLPIPHIYSSIES